MKKIKYFGFIICITLGIPFVNSYYFGMKSFDNTIENIIQIEKKYPQIKNQIIGFIFDPRYPHHLDTIKNLKNKFEERRIFHITISPNMYNAKDVAIGKFDDVYISVFEAIKNTNIKVIFRTMHEMNGGRYPRSSDPKSFQKARIHVWKLSRQIGLDQHNILFDFSINHRDMPALGEPKQTAVLIKCTPGKKQEKNCLTFEDYYPGDKYVDIIGFSFYNWGKATSDRKRLNPDQILNDKEFDTLNRIRKFDKAIFIDEVGTTSVKYNKYYDQEKSKKIYDNIRDYKNYWLMHFNNFLYENTDILGFCYFNTDYTNGLAHPKKGEADRAVINLNNNKIYNGIFDLAQNSNKNYYKNKLLDLFKTTTIKHNGKKIFVKKQNKKIILSIKKYLDNTFDNYKYGKILFLKNLEKNLKNNDHKEILQTVYKIID